MFALAEEETSIDLITLRRTAPRGKEEAAGGAAYVASLTDGLPRGSMSALREDGQEKATQDS